MNILLLGATGRTGKHVLNELLARGHFVTTFVRNRCPSIDHSRLKCLAAPEVATLMKQQSLTCVDAIINVLNISRVNDFPWAPLRTPPTFLSDTMKILLQKMTQDGVQRIIVTSAWGAKDSKQMIPGWFRWLIDHSNVGVAYRDHERQEDLLCSSGLDWTIVRPVGLINAATVRPVTELCGNLRPPKLILSRLELAKSLVDIAENRKFVREVVTLSRE